MSRVSTSIATIILFICFGATQRPAQATGIPVIDVANLQQQITQYANMINQLRQLEAQLELAKQQFDSMTGSRGLGGKWRENYVQNIPSNWRATLDVMGDDGATGRLARQIRDQASQLDSDNFENVAEDFIDVLSKGMAQASIGQALNAQVYDGSGARFERIKELMDEINSTKDMKAVSDLQARLASENVMLLNELVKLESMNGMLQQANAVRAQEEAQRDYEVTSRKY